MQKCLLLAEGIFLRIIPVVSIWVPNLESSPVQGGLPVVLSCSKKLNNIEHPNSSTGEVLKGLVNYGGIVDRLSAVVSKLTFP